MAKEVFCLRDRVNALLSALDMPPVGEHPYPVAYYKATHDGIVHTTSDVGCAIGAIEARLKSWIKKCDGRPALLGERFRHVEAALRLRFLFGRQDLPSPLGPDYWESPYYHWLGAQAEAA